MNYASYCARLGDTIEVRDWNGKFCAKGIVVSRNVMTMNDIVLKATAKSEDYNVSCLLNIKKYYDFDHRFNIVHTRVVLTEKRNWTFEMK